MTSTSRSGRAEGGTGPVQRRGEGSPSKIFSRVELENLWDLEKTDARGKNQRSEAAVLTRENILESKKIFELQASCLLFERLVRRNKKLTFNVKEIGDQEARDRALWLAGLCEQFNDLFHVEKSEDELTIHAKRSVQFPPAVKTKQQDRKVFRINKKYFLSCTKNIGNCRVCLNCQEN